MSLDLTEELFSLMLEDDGEFVSMKASFRCFFIGNPVTPVDFGDLL